VCQICHYLAFDFDHTPIPAAELLFICNLISWIVTRLYVYPTYVLRSTWQVRAQNLGGGSGAWTTDTNNRASKTGGRSGPSAPTRNSRAKNKKILPRQQETPHAPTRNCANKKLLPPRQQETPPPARAPTASFSCTPRTTFF
jgi:hypothetical protein